MKSYFRKEIDAIAGYVPGEQPKMSNLIKLNTMKILIRHLLQ